MSNVNTDFDLQAYLTRGVERVVKDALKATLKDPKESAFMLRFAAASKVATKKREQAEKAGEHVPAVQELQSVYRRLQVSLYTAVLEDHAEVNEP